MVNTLVLSDEGGEAVIIDPGNSSSFENEQLEEYVRTHQLTIKYILNTHPHIDHVVGNSWCVQQYNAPLQIHEKGLSVYNHAPAYGSVFGMNIENLPAPTQFLCEGDKICFGEQCLQVLYTPGHCDGSVSFYDEKNKIIICGDLIFEGGVGRADLPTGDMPTLITMIKEKIMVLDDQITIYPGHGDCTTIGNERKYNPYINQ